MQCDTAQKTQHNLKSGRSLRRGTRTGKGPTFPVCEKHFSEGQFERNYVNELLGLEKQKKLLTGAFPDKIQEGNLSIKVILALHYYSVKHTVCPRSSVILKSICTEHPIHCIDSIVRHIIITICPRSSDPFNIVTYFIKWVTTSWTDSILVEKGIKGHLSISRRKSDRR